VDVDSENSEGNSTTNATIMLFESSSWVDNYFDDQSSTIVDKLLVDSWSRDDDRQILDCKYSGGRRYEYSSCKYNLVATAA
jgi:hypothetical protein